MKMKKIIKKASLAIALISALSFSLAGCGTNTQKTTSAKPETKVTAKADAQKETANQYIVVEAGSKLGPDGKLHDAFINGDITITAGQPVTLHFLNYDDGTHTYTSPELGLNVKIKGSVKKGQPMETIYTFTPKKAGTFTWICADPCDGQNGQWAMAQQGYMQGKITVTNDNTQHVSLVINAGYKLGPDGKLHDAFTPGDFTINAGSPVEITIYNFDDGTHTLTANDLGVNMQENGSKQKGDPSITKYTFTPSKKGTFKWYCADRCDGQNGQWAMAQDNYMMGSITVK